ECGFQRSKIVLMLVNDLQNHITLCIIGHLLQLVAERNAETSSEFFQESLVCAEFTLKIR
ncbi:MAG: hypothetical protein EGQ64_00300, partial [Ruminococcaceae bacterium]|nr:hypothetical protein [Oscillospiraceae bacterium]